MYAAISRSEPPRAAAPEPAGDPVTLARYRGGLLLSFVARDGRTRLADLRQTPPCRVAFPRPAAGEPVTAVLVTTSGGLAGGDRLDLDISAGNGASVLVTSQAAEKVYRSLSPETRVRTRLTAGAGAWLEWMPQETILFDRARLRRRIEVDMAPSSRVLAAEMLVLGRTASGERFASCLLHDEWRVTRDGRLLWVDALHLAEPMTEPLESAAGLMGANAMATVIFAGEDARNLVDRARSILDGLRDDGVCRGATVVGGLLLVRLLSRDVQALRKCLARVVAALRSAVAGLPARAPAIWRM